MGLWSTNSPHKHNMVGVVLWSPFTCSPGVFGGWDSCQFTVVIMLKSFENGQMQFTLDTRLFFFAVYGNIPALQPACGASPPPGLAFRSRRTSEDWSEWTCLWWMMSCGNDSNSIACVTSRLSHPNSINLHPQEFKEVHFNAPMQAHSKT